MIASVLIVIGLGFWQLNEFAITPGQSTNVEPSLTIKGLAVNAHPDKVNIVDVWLQQLTMLQFVLMHFQNNVAFVSGDQLVTPGVPTSELNAQGFQEMNDAKLAAEYAAFTALGWHISSTPTGAVITDVLANSPAEAAGLAVQDRVVAANGRPIRTGCDLIAVLNKLPGTSELKLDVVAGSFSASGHLVTGKEHTYVLRTRSMPAGATPDGCPGITTPDKSYLGVGVEDGVAYHLPAAITIRTDNIGGPSGGLAMTLAIMDRLSKDSLTGGHAIAVTGTIDASGNVGDIGGLAQKTIAVERAGVKYFLVPADQKSEATAVASRGLHVIGVSTLAQALKELRRLGGAIPTPITSPTNP